MQVGVGVGVAVREEHLIIVEFEGTGECEGVESSNDSINLFALEVVAEVVDVEASPVPPYLVSGLEFVRKGQNAHSVVVQRVRLSQVDDVEFNRLALLRVAHSEEVPLRVSVGVDVILKD